jgi:hypothetical protein
VGVGSIYMWAILVLLIAAWISRPGQLPFRVR